MMIELLLAGLDDVFGGDGWQGPNLRGPLRRMRVEEALWRPADQEPNAWEIALHCAYWKYAVWRRLTGQRRGSFPRAGSDFPACGPSLAEDLALLDTMHANLCAAVAALDPGTLDRPAGGTGKTTVRALVQGAAAHDAYHAGQLQLLRRLYRARNQ